MVQKQASFAGTVSEAISETGLSQRKFADRMGIPLRTIEDWKAGRRIPNDITIEGFLRRYEEIFKN